MAIHPPESDGKSELQHRFPEMRPLDSPPGLFTLNGFGFGMYGKRDFDAASGTYIKTRCICALFVPIIALDAFRVANAPKGWYFLGKEKVSGFAKSWRWGVAAVVTVVAATSIQNAHLRSPEYRAGKARESALALAASGKRLEAADVYRGVLREGIGNATEWRTAMVALVKAEIASPEPARAAAAVRYADQKRTLPGSREPLIPDLADRALEAASKAGNPADAEKILSSFRPNPADLTRVHTERRKALESLHAVKPDDQEVRIQLALIREEFGALDGALELLSATAVNLGTGEGARLYGHLLLGDDRPQEALPHLERYLERRIDDWSHQSQALQSTYESSRERILEQLNTAGGPPGFRDRYEAAGEAGQQQMVEDYLAEQLAKDSALLAAQQRYQDSAAIVPSIMDLGTARLRVAQSESDLEKRKLLLKAAEEAFLSLKNVAGESDEYRFFLGQIYFWSGREPEGRALFDELLAAKQRNVATLYGLARIFRDLGEDSEACKLLEEALPKAQETSEKTMIISLRAVLARTTDEKIEWLSKADASAPGLFINLAEARGQKAEEIGNKETARRQYKEALAGYEKQERTSSSLNNAAILHRSLYRLDGDRANFEKAAILLSEAVDLNPANSILTFNAASSLLDSAVLRLAGDRIHPDLLQYDIGLTSLQFLYEKEAEKTALVNGLKADPNFRKATAYFWDALLLAPKDVDLYAWGLEVFYFTGDNASLERLAAKVAEQEFDFSAQKEDTTRFFKGERDAEMKISIHASRERVAALESGMTDPRSKAMAQASVSAAKMAGYSIGERTTDADTWMGDLKAALAAVPCSRLRSCMESATEIAALEKLAASDPECAEIIETDRRLLATSQLLQLLVRADGELGDRVRRHPAVIEARELKSQVAALFPGHFDLADWMLVEGLHPENDAALESLCTANRTGRLMEQLRLSIQPESASSLLTKFWSLMQAEDEAAAKELLPRMETAGLKLPSLVSAN